MTSRRHDRVILDTLEAMEPEAFASDVWRVTWRGRDPLRGSTAEGRWSPAGEFEVLYTSLERDGALTEIGYRLSLEPVWPSKVQHQVHRIAARTERSLRFSDVAALAPLGVEAARYASFDYGPTQALAAAARFLGFDSLIVPSARSPALHLVVFLDAILNDGALNVLESEDVDWDGWRRKRR
ncbi:MAG: RES family NAD+ phosphorylase [Roseomonas sp.]|nr:RES family NAD+ phosphorylase [Roseomonas sp.]